MEGRSRSTFFSSLNYGSNVNNLALDSQNTDSVNASGHGNHSSSIGWMGQSSFIGSSNNPIDLEENNAEHGWLPSPDVNIETNQSLEEVHLEPESDEIFSTDWLTLGPSSPSESATSDVVPEMLDLNVALEVSDENISQEIGAGYLNRTSSLERNAGTFERNTRQRTNPVSEPQFPFSSTSSSIHVGSTSEMLEPSYWMTNSSFGSTSSVPPVITASGSDALWLENSGYIARSTSVQSVLVPGQNVMPSRAFPGNYSSHNGTTADQLLAPRGFPQNNVTGGFQNGFAGGVSLPPTPGFPLRNLAEGYAERQLNIVNNSMTRLSGLVSGGQIGYHQPASSTSVTMRGMLESRPDNLRAIQAHPMPRILMMRAEGHNTSVPAMLPLLVQFIPDQQRARLVHHDLQIRQWAHGTALQYQELLVLEEIGTVNTGLSEEAVLGGIKPHRYQSMKLGLPVEEESCCVCLEKYVDGEELGKLDCGHEFHFNCIKTWLMEKNSCPICRKIALVI